MFFYMTAMLHINYVTNFSVGQSFKFANSKQLSLTGGLATCLYDIIEIITYFIIIIGSEQRVGAIFLFLHQNSQHFCKIPSRDNLMALKIFVFFILFSFRFKRKILSEQFLQEIVTLICYQRCK